MTMDELSAAAKRIDDAFALVCAALEQTIENVVECFDIYQEEKPSPKQHALLKPQKRKYSFPHYQYTLSFQRNLPYQRRIF